MKLFSWFMKKKDMASSPVVMIPVNSSVKKINPMWPEAQVRDNAQVKSIQQTSTTIDLTYKNKTPLNIKKT